MKKIFLSIAFIIFIAVFHSHAQETLGAHPVFFVDSIRVKNLDNVNPNDIASVTVYTGDDALKILGDEAKDGIAYMETKPFSRRRYWRYFISKSTDYARIAPTPESDTSVLYIINKKIQAGNFYGALTSINDKVFKSLQIIDKETLIKDYGVTDKQYGVIIISDVPKNLFNGKNSF